MVLLAAPKGEELQSWEAAMIFGLVSMFVSRFVPHFNRAVGRSGRRLPWPFRLLYPIDREEQMIAIQQRLIFWMGLGFFVIGTVGYLVRALLP
jgi:hypothetical protein